MPDMSSDFSPMKCPKCFGWFHSEAAYVVHNCLVKKDKQDQGKLRWELMPWKPLEFVVRVLMFGANKYEDHGWQKIENGEARYKDAGMRHLVASMMGEKNDPETGLPTLAHAICSLLFALWHERKGE